jgi:hypothetical protein
VEERSCVSSVEGAFVECGGQCTDLVSYECETADKHEEDDEGDEIHDGAHDCGCGGAACVVESRVRVSGQRMAIRRCDHRQ